MIGAATCAGRSLTPLLSLGDVFFQFLNKTAAGSALIVNNCPTGRQYVVHGGCEERRKKHFFLSLVPFSMLKPDFRRAKMLW